MNGIRHPLEPTGEMIQYGVYATRSLLFLAPLDLGSELGDIIYNFYASDIDEAQEKFDSIVIGWNLQINF